MYKIESVPLGYKLTARAERVGKDWVSLGKDPDL
jgi:hypothetical protein